MSIFLLICSARNSNLFLIEFVFKCAKISLFMLWLRMFFSVVLQSLYILAESVSLDVHSPGTGCGLSLSGCQVKTLEILPTKLFDKIFEPFLFKCSLPLFRCWGLVLFELSITQMFFALHNSLS